MKKITLFYLFLLQITFALAQPGAIDSTFGTNGKVLSENYEGSGRSVAVQADGKIVIGGGGGWYGTDSSVIAGFLAVRYNADGTIDESFGDAGRALNDLADPLVSKTVYKIAIQPDGKIVAAGTYGFALALVRYNTDGSIDTGFGEGGIAIYQPSQTIYHIMNDMALLPDGRIVVVGDLHTHENDNDRSFIFCYTPSGVVDNSFGNNGEVIIYTQEISDIIAVAITKDSKILVGGNYLTVRKSILYRYNNDGTPDENFGENGFAYMAYGSNSSGSAVIDMVLTKDNRIVTLGSTNAKSNNGYLSLLVSKFLANGNPDSSYGTNGYSFIAFEKTSIYAGAMAINEGGNLLVTGGMSGLINANVVISIAPDGKIDSGFGTNGIATNTFLENSGNNLNSIALQEDGKIVVAGYALYQNFPYYRYYYILSRFDGYGIEKNKYVKIKKWLHRHGFTWDDFPGRNVSYYAVQRSSNGNNFTEIARLFNRNNQQQLSYADAAPLTGDNYYRLAAVSADGAVTYSNVLAIPNNTATVKVYPNPTKNNLQIEGLSATAKTKLVISDLNGVARMSAVANSSSYNWNINNLKPGNYILRITNGSNIITKKFLKE